MHLILHYGRMMFVDTRKCEHDEPEFMWHSSAFCVRTWTVAFLGVCAGEHIPTPATLSRLRGKAGCPSSTSGRADASEHRGSGSGAGVICARGRARKNALRFLSA